MEDITALLAFEVKKEMADRYFGFRKRIEDDTNAYTRRLEQSAQDLENKIGFTLLRIYTLLRTESLINSFISLVGLPRGLFYDRYIVESQTIHKRIFAGQEYRGLTRKRGIQIMFFDNYLQLVEDIDSYRKTLEELNEELETIREEINLFYKNNDIDSIMSFIRRLESPDSTLLNTMRPNGSGSPEQGLSAKLRLHPPPSVSETLPAIPSIPPLKQVKKQLKILLKSAIESRPDFDLRELTKQKT